MNIYLAARYIRREETREYARQLIEAGHKVTSRWIHGGEESDCTELQLSEEAFNDLCDIRAAACVISFTEPEAPFVGRGGRHVEFGYAMAFGLRLIIVGPRENIFHRLVAVEQFDTFAEALKAL